MKIGSRYFLSPLYIRFGPVWIYTTRSAAMFQIGTYSMRVIGLDKSGGTCRVTRLTIEFKRGETIKQLTIAWRPDVTHMNWNEKSYREKKKRLFFKEYGRMPGEPK